MNKNLFFNTSITNKTVVDKDGEEVLIIRGMANTTSKDRGGDVVLAEAWTTSNALANYLKNPIILAFHDYTLPIGKAISVTPTSTGLEIEVEISKSAGSIYGLIKDGVLKTFSVGFRVLDADWDHEHDLFIIKDLELYEISVVSVPMNQDSIFEVSKSFNDHDYREFKKQVMAKGIVPEVSLIHKLALELGIIKEIK